MAFIEYSYFGDDLHSLFDQVKNLRILGLTGPEIIWPDSQPQAGTDEHNSLYG